MLTPNEIFKIVRGWQNANQEFLAEQKIACGIEVRRDCVFVELSEATSSPRTRVTVAFAPPDFRKPAAILMAHTADELDRLVWDFLDERKREEQYHAVQAEQGQGWGEGHVS